jgi:2-dehydro-3-deoxygluconokinase
MLEFNQQPDRGDGRRLYLEGFGGDTANAAVAAARQGVRTAYVTAIGRDPAGDRFMELWAQEGVDCAGVLRSDDRPTAIYFVTHGNDGHAFHYYRRASAASAFRPADLPAALITGSGILYVSGISLGISASAADAVFSAMALAKQGGGRVALDTNYRALLWPPARAAAVIHAAVAEADMVFPGLEDAEALTGLTGLTDPDAIADFYLHLGPPLVVLKMGAEGVLVATRSARTRLPPFPCRVVDATGAGDTFCGSFLARIVAGDAPETAARYAGAAAALKCEGYGAVGPIPRAAEVLAALAR